MKMRPLTFEEIKTALTQQIQLYTVIAYLGVDLKPVRFAVERLNKVNRVMDAKAGRLARIYRRHDKPMFDNYWAAHAYKLKIQNGRNRAWTKNGVT